MPINGANRLVSKFSRLYAQADPEEQFALRVWMRGDFLGDCRQFITFALLSRSWRLFPSSHF